MALRFLKQSLKWLVMAPLDLIFNLACVLLLNWWVIFLARPVRESDWLYLQAKQKWQGHEQKLPDWLTWVETFDASLDTGWISGYFVPRDTYAPDNMPSFWRRKYYQWRWLNRNSGYGFSYYLLGIEMKKDTWTILKYVRAPESNGKGYQLFIAYSSEGFWNVNLQGKYGTYKLGWKAWNYWDWEKMNWYTNNKPWGPLWRTSVVCSINPFKRSEIDLPYLELKK